MADLPLLVGDYEIKSAKGADDIIAFWCDYLRKQDRYGGPQFNDTCVGWEFYIDHDTYVSPDGYEAPGAARVRVLEEKSWKGDPADTSSLIPTKIRVFDGGDPKPPYTENVMKANGFIQVGFLLEDESIWPQGYPPADLSNVTFVVQRGDEQFSCLGSDLADKLQNGDMLIVQRGSEKRSWAAVTISTPWEGHDGIFHIKNSNKTVLLTGGPFTAWDKYGNNEREITDIKDGEELVFVTSDSGEELFANNLTATWEFGEFTDISNLTSTYKMFYNANAFNSDISNWDTSNVTNMGRMFYNANAFDQDISNWDTSNVTDMSYLFYNARVFNQDISYWNVSNVTNMSDMFHNAKVFNQDISSWNVSNVTNMSKLFNNTPYNNDIGAWNTINVENMYGMFENAQSFNNDISSWNTSNVTNMVVMFKVAKVFNKDLSQWCVSKITMRPSFFDTDADAWFSSYQPKWGTCPRGEDS